MAHAGMVVDEFVLPMSARTCVNPSCGCAVEPEVDACSESCSGLAGLELEANKGCNCQHHECLGSAGRRGDLESGAFGAPPDDVAGARP
jgi:hypothetical protein